MPEAEEVARLFNSGQSYGEIARYFRVTKNVIAGICHRNGIRRRPNTSPVISAAEKAERAQDQRDLDMLCDIDDGHSLQQTADHWGVGKDYVRRLVKHARAA